MKEKQNTNFLTVDGAAQLVGLTHWTIRRWLQTKRLTRYKSGQHTLVSRVELLELVKPKKAADQ
jgi:excisionase family DNA binding protein